MWSCGNRSLWLTWLKRHMSKSPHGRQSRATLVRRAVWQRAETERGWGEYRGHSATIASNSRCHRRAGHWSLRAASSRGAPSRWCVSRPFPGDARSSPLPRGPEAPSPGHDSPESQRRVSAYGRTRRLLPTRPRRQGDDGAGKPGSGASDGASCRESPPSLAGRRHRHGIPRKELPPGESSRIDGRAGQTAY